MVIRLKNEAGANAEAIDIHFLFPGGTTFAEFHAFGVVTIAIIRGRPVAVEVEVEVLVAVLQLAAVTTSGG